MGKNLRKILFVLLIVFSAKFSYSQTYTLSNYIDWSTHNQNMWGPNGSPFTINMNQSLFHVDFNESFTVGAIENFAGGQFGAEAAINVWLDMGMNFSINGFSSGSVDLDYPVRVDLTFPDPYTFNPGQTVTINSWYDVLPGWNLETHFPTAGVMALDFYFGAGVSIDVNVCVYSCMNFNLIDVQVPVDTIHIFYLNSITGQAIYPCFVNGVFQFCNGTFPITFNNLFGIGLGGWITIPYVNTQDYLDPATKCLHADGDCTYVHLDLDLVQFLYAIAGVIPPPQGPAIQQFLSMLNGTIDIGYGVLIEYDLLDANLLLDFNLIQNFSFCPTIWAHLNFPTSVDYTVTDPANANALIDSGFTDSIVFAVDYDLNFVYPCYGYPQWPIDIAHSITSGFKNHTWDSIAFTFTLQAFEFTITLPISNMPNVTIPPFCVDVPYSCPSPGLPNAICYNQICSAPIYTPNINSLLSTIHIGPLIDLSIPLGYLPFTWFEETWNIAGLHDTVVPGTTLFPNPEMTSIITGNHIQCFGDTTWVAVYVDHGTPPYTFIWSTGDTVVTANPADSIHVFQGTYSCTVSDVNGCSQTHSITINVLNPEIFANLTGVDVLCHGDSTGSATVVASGGTPGFTYQWFPYGGTNTTASNLIAGTYTVVVTDAVGCTKTDSIVIDEPDSAFVMTIDSIEHVLCYSYNNGNINISVTGGTPPYSYQWSNGATTQDISNLIAGTYYVTITDDHDCIIIDTMDVIEPDSMIVHINSTSICYGQTITLNVDSTTGGTAPYQHLWNTGDTGTALTVNPLTTTLYTVQATDVNGCTSQVTPLVLYVTEQLQLTLLPSADSICIGDSLVINAVILGGGNITHIVHLSDGTSGTPPLIVYPQQDMTYTAWVTDSCDFITVYDSIFVTVMPLPPTAFSADETIGCQPFTVTFTETNPPEGQTYDWYFHDGFWASGNTVIHTFQDYGVFGVTMTATSYFGCVNSQTNNAMIIVYPKPVADFEFNPKLPNSLDMIFFDNYSSTHHAAHWSFGDGNTSEHINAFHTYASYGSYTIQLVAETEHGCKDTAYKDIYVKEISTLYIPNAFSPGGDGVNDIFLPVGQGLDNDDYHLMIFNRWGELVFETNDANLGWDGKTMQGNKAYEGVYTWLLYYREYQNYQEKRTGSVTLLR
ncbi:MAG: PKD domain-containing protein [Bacteroidales bacterium]|nr:PKD domain-containing protein [Bacteroidales bacterium]